MQYACVYSCMVVIFAALVTGGANLELKTTGQFLPLHVKWLQADASKWKCKELLITIIVNQSLGKKRLSETWAHWGCFPFLNAFVLDAMTIASRLLKSAKLVQKTCSQAMNWDLVDLKNKDHCDLAHQVVPIDCVLRVGAAAGKSISGRISWEGAMPCHHLLPRPSPQ